MSKENNGWISVKDRLPEISEFYGFRSESVLLYGDAENLGGSYAFIGYRVNDNRFYSDCGECYKVTHWQPLPGRPR